MKWTLQHTAPYGVLAAPYSMLAATYGESDAPYGVSATLHCVLALQDTHGISPFHFTFIWVKLLYRVLDVKWRWEKSNYHVCL